MKSFRHVAVATLLVILAGAVWAGADRILELQQSSLVRLENIRVEVHTFSEGLRLGLKADRIRQQLYEKLRQGGVAVIDPGRSNRADGDAAYPRLVCLVTVHEIQRQQVVAYHLELLLEQEVLLVVDRGRRLAAVTWRLSRLASAPAEQLHEQVMEKLLELADRFIQDYDAARRSAERCGEPNEPTIGNVPGRGGDSAKPAAAQSVEYKYVASKNGKVFHRPTCGAAKRILPANLVGYNSREQALADGKRPCKRCRP